MVNDLDKKLVLIDGYGFLFRAFFAIKNEMRRSDGTPTNGVYGFTRMLINLLVDLNATHIGVVFDSGKKTFRHAIYDKYKANRPPVPETLIPQFPLIREVAKSLNLCVLEKEGYEADDIIATLARQGEREGYEVLVVSSDKDLTQLVSDKIFIFDALKQIKLGITEVNEKWNVKRPEQVLDILSLMGDASDNVPGVPSIGAKTATDLINEFDNIDNLINNLDKVKSEKRRNALIENLDKLKLSKLLITLDENVPLEETLDTLQVKPINPLYLRDFLNEMEFFSIAKQIEKSFHLNEFFSEETTTCNSKFEYKKITAAAALNEIIKEFTKEIFIDFITEYNDNYDEIKVIVLTESCKKNIYYIPLIKNDIYDLFIKNDENTINIEKVLEILKPIFENDSIVKIGFNIKKLIRILKAYEIQMHNYEDIGVLSYVLDNGKFSHDLSSIIEQYLSHNVELKIKNIHENNNFLQDYEKNKSLSKITSDIFTFSCFKIEMILTLYKILNDRIQDSTLLNFYNMLEKPLIEVLADIEFEGIKIDIKELNNLSQYFQNKLTAIEKDIYAITKENFNINSPKQLGEILFEKLELPYGKKNKFHNYSTDIDILEALSEKGYEIADKILEYRHFSKLKTTYSDTLPQLIDKNHRIHTSFSNTYVITGRLSSNNPNLQNIPIKSEEGVQIRKAFIAKAGYKLIGADYSQIELRVLAEYANVKHLIELFQNGTDIHNETAKKIFPDQEITRELRGYAKAINFSIIYGTSAFGLSKRLNTNKKEAQKYMDNYFNLYPEVKEYMQKTIEFVKENHYVETLFKRKCFINMDVKAMQKSMLERLAINAPIQGTAADIIKKAMIKLYEKLQPFDAKIILQIHDELIIEVVENQAPQVAQIVKETMEQIVSFRIPLPVDVNMGDNWGEIH